MRIARAYPDRQKHRAALDRLQLECLPSDDPCPYKAGDFWWLVYDGKEPVAFCCTRPTPADSAWWYHARAGVVPAARGRGLQRKMLRVRESAARKAGGMVMVTDCTPVNVASANSLMACGYRLYTPSYKWATPTSIYWRKALCV